MFTVLWLLSLLGDVAFCNSVHDSAIDPYCGGAVSPVSLLQVGVRFGRSTAKDPHNTSDVEAEVVAAGPSSKLEALEQERGRMQREVLAEADATLHMQDHKRKFARAVNYGKKNVVCPFEHEEDGWRTVVPTSHGAKPIHVFVGTQADFVPEMPKDAGELNHEFGQFHGQEGQDKTIAKVVYGSDAAGQLGQFHSQEGQDKTIANIVYGSDAKGTTRYYVDLAANDAVLISNTASLDKDYGWQGLCIEPNPQYWDGLSRRGCDVAATVVGSKTNETIEFVMEGSFSGSIDGVFGGIKGEDLDNHDGVAVKRDTIAIDELFCKFQVPEVIDYFSLDIEGAEEMVMSSFPWHSYAIMALTVERPSQILKAALEAHGLVYVKDHGTFGDQLWLNRALPDFETVVAKVLADVPDQHPEFGTAID